EAAGEIELARDAMKPFDLAAFREGHLTPVLFGSALKNFGVRDLIGALAEFAPSPRGLEAASRHVDPHEPQMTGFVFKIQANMDPNHRDRIAFLRVSSGKLQRGMKAKMVREALQQMAEEGVVQLFVPSDGSGAIVGVVGALQLDVLAERLKVEYGLPVSFEPSRFEVCRWIEAEPGELDKFQRAY